MNETTVQVTILGPQLLQLTQVARRWSVVAELREVILQFLPFLYFGFECVIFVEEKNDRDTMQPTIVPYCSKEVQ